MHQKKFDHIKQGNPPFGVVVLLTTHEDLIGKLHLFIVWIDRDNNNFTSFCLNQIDDFRIVIQIARLHGKNKDKRIIGQILDDFFLFLKIKTRLYVLMHPH